MEKAIQDEDKDKGSPLNLCPEKKLDLREKEHNQVKINFKLVFRNKGITLGFLRLPVDGTF